MIIKLPEYVTEKSIRTFNESVSSFLASKCLTIVFDFSRVREMDSAAMETLLHCMNQIAQNDGTIRVSGMSPQAAIFLELTRMDAVFSMFKECPAAAPVASVPEFAANAVLRDDMQVTAA
jgi:anti-anti-sigma factor